MNKANPVDGELPSERPVNPFSVQEWQKVLFHLESAAKTGSRDSVHQLRVGLRQLLACIDFLDLEGTSRLRKQIKSWMAGPGKIRDLQVQQKLLHPWFTSYPALAGFDRFLDDRIKKISGKAWLPSQREIREVHDLVLTLILEPATRLEFSDLYQWNTRFLSTCRLVTLEMRKTDFSDEDSLHSLRLVVKKAKYTCWILDYFHPVPSEELDRLSSFQKKLGKIQDLSVLCANLRVFIRKNKKSAKSLRDVLGLLEEELVSLKAQFRDSVIGPV